jgi:DNA-directed RNA polymerase specialized sigma24 family protein
MKNKNEIINELFLRKDIDRYINKLSGYLYPELKSEVFEVFCRMPEQRLKDEYSKAHFRNWVKCVVKNIWLSNKFKKTFKKDSRVVTANIFDKETGEWGNDWIEELPAMAHDLLPYRELERRITKLPYLTRQLLNLYIENGSSIRRLFKKTCIPVKYISGQVKEAREQLRDYSAVDNDTTPKLIPTRSFDRSKDVEKWEQENYN